MFEIGIIVKPKGIRGELRVLPTTDDPSRFGLLKEVFLRPANNTASLEKLQKLTISSLRQQKNIIVLTVNEITDRTAAESLVGASLMIPDGWALPLDTNEYFVRDIIGCTATEEDGAVLGEITEVFTTGANDVYVIKAESGSFMVPAVKDVVRKVDIGGRRVVLRLLDGLRDLKA
jgi:16S rRNA processing protein RimM